MRILSIFFTSLLLISNISYAGSRETLQGVLMEILEKGIRKEHGVFLFEPKKIIVKDFMIFNPHRYDILVRLPNSKNKLEIYHYGDHEKYPEHLKIVSIMDISDEIIYLSGHHVHILNRTLIESPELGKWDEYAFNKAAYHQLKKKIDLKTVIQIILLRKKLQEKGILINDLGFPLNHTLKQNAQNTLEYLKSLDKTKPLKIYIK